MFVTWQARVRPFPQRSGKTIERVSAMTDRQVVVTRDSSAGALVAGIVAVLLIALAVWYFGFRGADTTDGGAVEVNVTVEEATTP